MSDTPDLGTIRAFIAVAEAGNFATAARTAGLTRSALGKALTRLEGRLGTRLLHRSTRRISLTVDGAEYLARTRQILSDLAEAEAGIRQDRPVARGVLRLTLPDAYGRLRVLPILKDFLREWPELSAEVNFTDRPINLVEEGVDLAVRIGSTETSAELVGRVVARSTIILCAAPAYLAERGRPKVLGELADHDRLHFGSRGEAMRWAVSAPSQATEQVAGPGRVTLDSAEAIRDMAVAGFGIAHLPRFLVADDLATGRLVAIFVDHPMREVPISVLYPNRRHLPARVRLFIDRLSQNLEVE